MGKNVEFKAYCPHVDVARAMCATLGAQLTRHHVQKDTYFRVPTGRLKLRESNVYDSSLIYYRRLDSPSLRESHFEIVPIMSKSAELKQLLGKALGIQVVVKKSRDTYELPASLINVDELEELGYFIEIEIDIKRSESEDKAFETAELLKNQFGISQAHIVPWSYAELKMMYQSSVRWRQKLRRAEQAGTIFLIDGASCSGKTTLVHQVIRENNVGVQFVPRYCTRKPRSVEVSESEYIFVSRQQFAQLAMSGTFIEYRDFKFGMSYGLPWIEAIAPLLEGRNALGIINLGNIVHVKKLLPEAVTILVDAPVETIRKRLLTRSSHKAEHIEERLDNARMVDGYKEFYDYVIDNDDGRLTFAISTLKDIIGSNVPTTKTEPQDAS